MTDFNQPLGGNQMPRFAGPATMMRLPTQATAEGLDVCFVGVPMDIGTSNRSGTRHGPRQIRAESCMLRPYNMATGAAPFDSLQVADMNAVLGGTLLIGAIFIGLNLLSDLLYSLLDPRVRRRVGQR